MLSLICQVHAAPSFVCHPSTIIEKGNDEQLKKIITERDECFVSSGVSLTKEM